MTRLSKRYINAFGALYGNNIIKEVKKRPKRVNSSLLEDQEQELVVAWLQKHDIPHHHSPNGGHRNYYEAAKFKRMGVSAGFPDLFIPISRKSYHGLLIELKRVSGGVVSESQLYWRDLLLKNGYAWYLAKGSQECIKIIKNYLELN